jgi:hypothetical protein
MEKAGDKLKKPAVKLIGDIVAYGKVIFNLKRAGLTGKVLG